MGYSILIFSTLILLVPGEGLQQTGLFLSLNGSAIDDDGFVNANDIVHGNYNALLCLTNDTNCCGGDNKMGDWIFPDGTYVGSYTSNLVDGTLQDSFFWRNRDQSVVRLNRRNNPSERGRFRCDLLSSTIYANILNIRPVSISPSAPINITIGESVTLQCSVIITPHPLPANTSTPEFEWFFGQTFSLPLNSTTTSDGRNYSSTIEIRSVRESDEGMYTCRLRGNQRTAVNTTVMVEFVSVTASGMNTAGETYSLVCTVTVAGSTDRPTITWVDPMNSTVPSDLINTTGNTNTLTFNPLSVSHAGNYTCRAMVGELAGEEVSTVIVNVPDITPAVSSSISGPLTVGQTGFSLNCNVSGIDHLHPVTLTYEWERNGQVITTGGQERILSLSPLSPSSHANYTCKVTVNSALLNSAEIVTSDVHFVSVQHASVTVSGSGTIGQNYILTCTVIGLIFTTYQWRKDGLVISDETGPTLRFSPLTFSDGGRYSCGNGTLFSDNKTIFLHIPSPASVAITSSVERPIVVGSDVTLACVVELGPAVGEAHLSLLMVDTQLSRDGIPLTLTGLAVTGTTLTYTIHFNSFHLQDAGNYTCTAIVRPRSLSTYLNGSSEVSSTARVKVGSPPPLSVEASQASPSDPVEVSWSPPPSGAITISGYRIHYGDGDNVLVPSIATYIGLSLNGSHIGLTVSLCTEALERDVASLCANTTVAGIKKDVDSSCSTKVGVAVGAVIISFFSVALAMIITTSVCLRIINKRKKAPGSGDDGISPSENIAYNEVKLYPIEGEGVYDNPNDINVTAESAQMEHPAGELVSQETVSTASTGGDSVQVCEQQQPSGDITVCDD